MENSAKLVIRDLCKSFGDHEVLKGVSLEARAGDVISIIGSSGSGKSTFLRCINFLEQPSQGSIQLNGEQLETSLDKNGNLKAKIPNNYKNAHPTDDGVSTFQFVVAYDGIRKYY